MGGLKLYGSIGLAIAALLAIGIHFAGDARVKHRLSGTTTALKKVEGEAARVLVAARRASDNPELTWTDVPVQVDLVGRSLKAFKGVVDIQTARIDALGIETARLKALSEQERRRADAAIAKRQSLIKVLEQDALTPGQRSDCARQLREVEAILDAVFEGEN